MAGQPFEIPCQFLNPLPRVTAAATALFAALEPSLGEPIGGFQHGAIIVLCRLGPGAGIVQPGAPTPCLA